AIRRLISIPWGSEPQLQIINIETHTFTFAELGIAAPILPVQAPIEKIPGAWENAPFDWNRRLYETDRYQVISSVELGQVGALRGYRFVELILYPVDVNPARQEIKVVLSARVKILLPGADMEETRTKRARYSSLSFEILADRLLMKTSLDAGILEINGMPEPPLLLIITEPTWESNTSLQNYINWKFSKGFRPVLVTTSTTGTTKELIKAYIQTAYNDWPIPPTYVLLIGDSGPIPAWTGIGSGAPKTDLNYSLLEGTDYMPDVDLGRWSVANVTHITNIITKSAAYEQNTLSGTRNWQKKAVFMASEDNYWVSEGTHNYVINTYLNPDGYTCDRLYCHTYNATTQQVINAHNDGRSLSIYSGHGAETYWADGPVLYQYQVNALTNTVFPFVQSYSCLTGNFTYGAECFMETWIRDDHSAIGAMGSTVNSYWTEDDILEKRVMEGFCANVYSGQENQTWMAGMMNYGKVRYYAYFGNNTTTRRYFEMYNLLGDPSIDLWTANPTSPTISHASELLVGQRTFDVNIADFSDWVLVCVYDEYHEIYSTQYLFEAGTATMNLGSGASVPGILHIVVTGHDCAPYAGTASIIPSAAIALVKPNGGETWQTGTTDTIAWSFNGLSGTVSIELNRDYPSGTWEPLYSGIPVGNAMQLWPITGPGSGNVRIRISSETMPSVSDISDANFTIQWVVPQVVVSPVGDDAELRWISTGSPYYRIYSDATPSGAFSTFEGSTANTFFYDEDAFSEGEMKFYRVVGSTEP
ncbi:MAG: hypothetical protein FJY66_04570, partial [Calditrichaeota bacterium]|nr:hypothetical protein [Calditrichota bacterium]